MVIEAAAKIRSYESIVDIITGGNSSIFAKGERTGPIVFDTTLTAAMIFLIVLKTFFS